MSVEIRSQLPIVKFYAFYKLVADVIIEFELGDKHVDESRPGHRVVELDDGTTVLIIRDSITRSKTKKLIPEAQIYEKEHEDLPTSFLE